MEKCRIASALLALMIASFFVMPVQCIGTPSAELPGNNFPPEEPEDISGVYFAQTGSYVEHTPSIIQTFNGSYFLAYESASSISGKFTINMTWSADGINWNPDWVAITSAGTMGNRHPTLIQRQDGLLMMAYFSDRSGAYRVYTATSSNGRTWTESSALALQNPAVNPFLIQTEIGDYALSYQRYGSVSDGSYFAISANGTTTWTAPATRVTNYVLPRLTERVGGGYLMTYQGGTTGSTFDIRYRTSADGITWSAETRLTYTGNSHDSFPMKLTNATYMVFFCTSISGGGYDLYRKWSPDLATWSGNELIPTANSRFDTEPHPCQLGYNQTILLSWGYESSGTVGAYENVDVALLWIEDVGAIPTYDIHLGEGWNLVSFPLIIANTSIDAVLTSIDGQYEVVKAYDSSDSQDPWKSYRIGGTANDLTNIDNTMGVWIKTTSYCVLSIDGTVPTTTEIQLMTGWNLVGYPSNLKVASEALAGTGADMISIYDDTLPGSGSIRDYTDLTGVIMRPNFGYWVHVPADTLWTVDW